MSNLNAIIEGCMPDTPHQLSYCNTTLFIPENAAVLLSPHDIHPRRYLLYARTQDFLSFDVKRNPYFDSNLNSQDPNKLFSGGWPLTRSLSNFRWIFDAQRSLTTNDGRIFVEASYFHKNWRWYLEAVPTILRECGEVFREEKGLEFFNSNPSRAY